MRILLLINPHAGTSGTPPRVTLQELAPLLSGHTVEVLAPDSGAAAEAAARQAVADGFERVLISGGDGTIHSVLPALAGSRTALGILPTGTVNVLAREFRIPTDLADAFQVALNGEERQIDLGSANDQPFVLMAGLGFDARVVADVMPQLKDLFGPLAYVTAGLQALGSHKKSTFHLTMEDLDVQVPAWMMIVGNAAYYTYQMSLSPGARIDDGLLDVCLFAEQTALDRVTQIMAAAVGLHTLHHNVTLFRTRALTVTATPPVQVQLDGDPAGESPVTIRVLPQALRVMTPTMRVVPA